MSLLALGEALSGTRTLGAEGRTLRVGGWTIALEGLDLTTASALDRRWGGFVAPGATREAEASVRLLDAGPGCFLVAEPGEPYRLEARGQEVVSYHFVARRGGGEDWSAAIASSDGERKERILDNLARLLVARVALREGGFPLHGAGIVRGGRSFIFAGPSRAGKSTAGKLAAPDLSLGDDFAVILPRETGFAAAAVPFDNGECAPSGAPPAPAGLSGVFRLVKTEAAPGIERLSGPLAAAWLIGCAAFPWAVPDLAGRLLPVAEAIVRAGICAQLHFAPTTDVAALIDGPWGGPAGG